MNSGSESVPAALRPTTDGSMAERFQRSRGCEVKGSFAQPDWQKMPNDSCKRPVQASRVLI